MESRRFPPRWSVGHSPSIAFVRFLMKIKELSAGNLLV